MTDHTVLIKAKNMDFTLLFDPGTLLSRWFYFYKFPFCWPHQWFTIKHQTNSHHLYMITAGSVVLLTAMKMMFSALSKEESVYMSSPCAMSSCFNTTLWNDMEPVKSILMCHWIPFAKILANLHIFLKREKKTVLSQQWHSDRTCGIIQSL